ncbi:hypothetical protein ABZX98_25240 [Streptomyces sp. NPDC002992]|uniref:hypothetical protein n=1 Tax=Streptomyces sp. NPDC002992 TaxID=3154273 RepID=UPI0033B4D24A
MKGHRPAPPPRRLARTKPRAELRLPEHLGEAERQNWIARLGREARAAARLKHPGIITVHDRISGPDGRPWIVMELVSACTSPLRTEPRN